MVSEGLFLSNHWSTCYKILHLMLVDALPSWNSSIFISSVQYSPVRYSNINLLFWSQLHIDQSTTPPFLKPPSHLCLIPTFIPTGHLWWANCHRYSEPSKRVAPTWGGPLFGQESHGELTGTRLPKPGMLTTKKWGCIKKKCGSTTHGTLDMFKMTTKKCGAFLMNNRDRTPRNRDEHDIKW